MSKNPGQYRCCLILTTALAIVTSGADTPIRNYPLSAYPPQLLVTEEATCQDSDNNLIPCPQHHSQFHHSKYSQLET